MEQGKISGFFKKYPLIIGILCVIIAKIGLKIMSLNSYGNYGMALGRIIVAAVCILLMWPVAGSRWLKFPGGGWKATYKVFNYGVIIFGAGAIILIVLAAIAGSQFNPNWAGDVISLAVLCIAIGLMEEVIFRRGLFDFGMLQFPHMKNKAMWMAVITSFIFGFLHVMMNLSWDWLAISTALLKTLVTGSFGFIMCASVIAGENLWAVVLIHALNDFTPQIISIISNGQSNIESYVTSSESGASPIATIVPFIIGLLLYLPALIRSVKIIKKYDEENSTNSCDG